MDVLSMLIQHYHSVNWTWITEINTIYVDLTQKGSSRPETPKSSFKMLTIFNKD